MILYQLQKTGVAHPVKCYITNGKKRILFPAANDLLLRKQKRLQSEVSFSRTNQQKDA
jgi:hypothetical protein